MGEPNSDRAEPYVGDDTAFGHAGSDKLFGGTEDRLYGEDGNDTLHGHRGSDLLVGGPGEDHLFRASGNDTTYTGTLEESDKDSDEISCGEGPEDTVYLSGPEHSGHNIDDSWRRNLLLAGVTKSFARGRGPAPASPAFR